MFILFLLLILLLFIFSSLFRCFVFNLHNVAYYSVRDIYEYFKYKKWKNFTESGIDLYIGMFGRGKTLSIVHRVRKIYETYGDSIKFISNVELKGIPYIPLINFNQLLDLQAEPEDGVQGYVVVIDEVSSVLSNRNYANFPLELLSTLTQQRKRHIKILSSCQRYYMCDKLYRTLSNYVYDCDKLWRFQTWRKYDAWDYENAMNPRLIKCLGVGTWFVKNRDFESYSTEQMITKDMCNAFISNEESIIRKGFDATTNLDAISKPSRALSRYRKARYK